MQAELLSDIRTEDVPIVAFHNTLQAFRAIVVDFKERGRERSRAVGTVEAFATVRTHLGIIKCSMNYQMFPECSHELSKVPSMFP